MKLETAAPLNPALVSLSTKKPKVDLAQIEETAKNFEAMFMTEMLKPMFEGLDVDSNFGGGKGEEMFRDFMLDEYGKSMAATGTLGIADMVKKQLIEMQSLADEPKAVPEVAQEMHSIMEDNAGEDTNV